MYVSCLSLYYVKSCKVTNVLSAKLALTGFESDRYAMIVDDKGVMRTQRKDAKLALIRTAISFGRMDSVTLIFPDSATEYEICWDSVTCWERTEGILHLAGTIWHESKMCRVKIHDDEADAVDMGDYIASVLTEYLRKPSRLVRYTDDFPRVHYSSALGRNIVVSFSDGYPFLIVAQSSLDDLCKRLGNGEDIDMTRFRPNIVITGCAPHEDETWKRIRIGGVDFEFAKKCPRCPTIQVDQETGIRGKEPRATLQNYRNEGKGTFFGSNWVHLQYGPGKEIHVGDPVEVIT